MATRTRDLTFETLTVEQEGRVVVLRICAPPYNFMTAQMQKDLDTLTAAVDDDPSVGAVVVTGGIPGRYITHFDIAEILAATEGNTLPLSHKVALNLMRGMDAIEGLPGGERALERSPVSGLLNVTRFSEVVLRIMRSPAVYIAAINGPCGGGGVEMSVCFDVRLAGDDDSVGFILPELLIGLTTTVGGQRLAQLIGPARALEMMLEGRMYSAHEALHMGLVNRLVPADDLIDAAKELGVRYARRNRETVAAQKRIFNEGLHLSPADCLRMEGAANASAILSGPAAKALRNWIEMQQEHNGDSVFLINPQPWQRGEAVDLTAQKEH